MFIWGTIGYTVIRQLYFSGRDVKEDYIPYMVKEADTTGQGYDLIAGYRDPFGAGIQQGTDKEAGSHPGNNGRTGSLHVNSPTHFVYWPGVEYLGTIFNDRKKVALIRMGGANLLLQEGEKKDEVKLIKIYNDSVLLNFQGENKIFGKNK